MGLVLEQDGAEARLVNGNFYLKKNNERRRSGQRDSTKYEASRRKAESRDRHDGVNM